MLHCSRLFAVENMHEHAGGVAAGRRTRVVATISWQSPWYKQTARSGLFLGHDADPASLRVVDDVRPTVPVDKAGRVGRLQDNAGQIDVASAFDIQLGVANDPGFRNWKV